MNKIRAGDAVAYRRLFNFLIECQSLDHFPSDVDPLDSSDVICIILANVTSSLAGLLYGLSFLWDRKQCWRKNIRSNIVSEQNLKLRKVIKFNDTQIENVLLSKLQEKTSSWKKLK